MKTNKFYLDFGGFYDSIHFDNIQDLIEYLDIKDDNINYNETHKEYCKEFVNELNNYLEIDLKFTGIYSPRFYNFETDKIEVEINENDYKKIIDNYLNNKECIEYINEASSSKDGFVSFCSGIDNLKNEPHLLLEYIFKYILWIDTELSDSELTYEISENIYDNLIIVENEILV
jgi:hypothetical protein